MKGDYKMIQEVTYLNEVKFRNQLRRDLDGKGVASVANKADQYRKGVVHVESTRDGDWFRVYYYGWNAENKAAVSLKLFQVLHLTGYEIKFVDERTLGGSVRQVAVYRKRA